MSEKFKIQTERFESSARCLDCPWNYQGAALYQKAKARVRTTGHTVRTKKESEIQQQPPTQG